MQVVVAYTGSLGEKHLLSYVQGHVKLVNMQEEALNSFNWFEFARAQVVVEQPTVAASVRESLAVIAMAGFEGSSPSRWMSPLELSQLGGNGAESSTPLAGQVARGLEVKRQPPAKLDVDRRVTLGYPGFEEGVEPEIIVDMHPFRLGEKMPRKYPVGITLFFESESPGADPQHTGPCGCRECAPSGCGKPGTYFPKYRYYFCARCYTECLLAFMSDKPRDEVANVSRRGQKVDLGGQMGFSDLLLKLPKSPKNDLGGKGQSRRGPGAGRP